MPHRICHLFAMILLFCNPNDIEHLWEVAYNNMSEDYSQHTDNQNWVLRQVAIDINKVLNTHSHHWTDFVGLPILMDQELMPIEMNEQLNQLIYEETHHDMTEINQTLQNLQRLNAEQRNVFDTVKNVIHHDHHDNLFFLEGPGGTGKPFVYETIISQIRSENKIVLCVASSGIAASLLTGGRTAHRHFKISINLDQNSHYNI